jgi:hypothetical protein
LPYRVRNIVNEAFEAARRQALRDGTLHEQNLMAARRFWADARLEEFVCDVGATYALGRSFDYQHVRLCALLGGHLFEPELGQRSTHPAHAARMRIVLAALQASGAVEDVVAVHELTDSLGISWERDRRPITSAIPMICSSSWPLRWFKHAERSASPTP